MASNGLPPLFYWQGREEGGAESAPISLEGSPQQPLSQKVGCSDTPSVLTVDVTGPVHLY